VTLAAAACAWNATARRAAGEGEGAGPARREREGDANIRVTKWVNARLCSNRRNCLERYLSHGRRGRKKKEKGSNFKGKEAGRQPTI